MTKIQTNTLEEMCDLIADCPHSTPKWTDTGHLVIRNQNIRNGRLDLSDKSYTNHKDYLVRVRRAVPQGGDLIFTREAPMGEICQVPEGLECCVGQRQVLLRPAQGVSSDYLLYAMQSPFVRHQIFWNEGTGSTVSNVRIPVLKKLEIPRQGQSESSIADVLKSLDDKIELNRRMNETLEEMARALFRDWFVDFGPTRRQMEGATDPAAIMGHAFPPEKAATLAPLFPVKVGDNGLPEGWEKRELRSALTLNYGRSLTKKDRKPGPFNVYGSGGVSGTHEAALAKGPSVIVGRKGTVGSLYWTHDDFFAIDTVFYVTSDYPMVFCHRLLETLGLETMNTDAAVPGLNRDNAYRQEFAFGGGDLIKAYANFVGTLTDKSGANKKENQTLAALRDLLLPKLMSGEIRLKDAEDTL